eukprot:CAMPEP_0172913814 /NCGR_PEP_ID=MMETSP1075-20121228/191157_1 /TAXON_ID=2916 /ORGANISM="Ceratium fusus, Strain PA161109" /LENGTH=70 /DNA_ID=CAMNT_0013772611 /DNA_START=29 /DNA_END=237 /DNA_ORIENTATION=+
MPPKVRAQEPNGASDGAIAIPPAHRPPAGTRPRPPAGPPVTKLEGDNTALGPRPPPGPPNRAPGPRPPGV